MPVWEHVVPTILEGCISRTGDDTHTHTNNTHTWQATCTVHSLPNAEFGKSLAMDELQKYLVSPRKSGLHKTMRSIIWHTNLMISALDARIATPESQCGNNKSCRWIWTPWTPSLEEGCQCPSLDLCHHRTTVSQMWTSED